MVKVTADLFKVLADPEAERVLARLYNAALRQNAALASYVMPKIFPSSGKGRDRVTENDYSYDDRYIPIVPAQGTFLYLQARALNAKNILECVTSPGISTIYLAKAAKENAGKVLTTGYSLNSMNAARQSFEEAGLSTYIEILGGEANRALKNLSGNLDFVLLDGWSDQIYTVFKLIEPQLTRGAVVFVDNVNGFNPSGQAYLDYVHNPENGYISSIIYPQKSMAFTIKIEPYKMTERLLSKYSKHVSEIGFQLRDFLLQNLPGLIEQPDESANLIGFGYGKGDEDRICTIIPSTTGIKLRFYKGNQLPDPKKILKGSGKVHRFVQIKSVKEIESSALRDLLQHAVIAHTIEQARKYISNSL